MEQKIVKKFNKISKNDITITEIKDQVISITHNQSNTLKNTFENTVFINVVFEDCVFKTLNASDCEFINCTFKNVTVNDADFNLCRFRGCNLESLHFDGQVRLTKSQFINSKFGKEFKLDKMEIWHSSFVNCSIPYPMYIVGNGDTYDYIFPDSNTSCCTIYLNNGHEVRSSEIKIEHMDSQIVKRILEIFKN